MNDLIRRTIRTFLAKTRVFIIAVILIPIFSFFGIFSTTTAASTISLGTAGNFAILAGAGITSTGPANIGGDVGSYPTASITGIPWCNGCLAGTNHVGDLVTQTAKTDLQTAVNTLSTYATTNTVTSDLGGQTLGPGVYTGNTPIYFMSVNGTLTLDGGGDPNSLFIFKAVRLSTGSSGTQIKLINGANVCNVYWDLTTFVVVSSVNIGSGTKFYGNVLTDGNITVNSSSAIVGGLLTTAGKVTMLDSNTAAPTCEHNIDSPTPTPSPTPSPTQSVTPTPTPTTSPSSTPTPNSTCLMATQSSGSSSGGSSSGSSSSTTYISVPCPQNSPIPSPSSTPSATPTISISPSPVPTSSLFPTPTPTSFVTPTTEPTVKPSTPPTIEPTVKPTVKPTSVLPSPTTTSDIGSTPNPTPSVTPSNPLIIQQILNKPKGYVATDKGAAASLSYLKASAPMKISIPSIGMTTSIIKLGLDSSGALQVPTTGAVAGWYTGSPTPGELGPSIIVAHVDMGGKLGVFFHLKDLKIGAKIDVLREDGKTAIFEVTQKAIYLKSKFPTTKIYGNIDFAGLRLITCGGKFDSKIGHYLSNVVIYAKAISN